MSQCIDRFFDQSHHCIGARTKGCRDYSASINRKYVAATAALSQLAIAFHRAGIPEEKIPALHKAVEDGKYVLMLRAAEFALPQCGIRRTFRGRRHRTEMHALRLARRARSVWGVAPDPQHPLGRRGK
jgi:hypothetical protein